MRKQNQWLRKALDRPDLPMMNPGKKDNVYVGKVGGESRQAKAVFAVADERYT